MPSCGDHADPPVLLPQRECLALLDLDLQPVGIDLPHRGFGDPWARLEAGAGTLDVEKQERRAPRHLGGCQHVRFAQLTAPGDRQVLDAEAGGIGQDIPRILELGENDRKVVAAHRAVEDAGEQQDHGGGGAGAARQAPLPQWQEIASKRPLEADRDFEFQGKPGRPRGPGSKPLQRFKEASSTIH